MQEVQIIQLLSSDLVRSYKMTVIFYTKETLIGVIEYALIEWGNDEFTSMTKAEYDKEYPNGVNEASTI